MNLEQALARINALEEENASLMNEVLSLNKRNLALQSTLEGITELGKKCVMEDKKPLKSDQQLSNMGQTHKSNQEAAELDELDKMISALEKNKESVSQKIETCTKERDFLLDQRKQVDFKKAQTIFSMENSCGPIVEQLQKEIDYMTKELVEIEEKIENLNVQIDDCQCNQSNILSEIEHLHKIRNEKAQH